MVHDYIFTFETDNELFNAEASGYIDYYDLVRICRKVSDVGTMDYPCKSRETFERHLAEYKDSIVRIYPAKSYYDVNDYL